MYSWKESRLTVRQQHCRRSGQGKPASFCCDITENSGATQTKCPHPISMVEECPAFCGLFVQDLLTVIDHFSWYPEVKIVKPLSAEPVIPLCGQNILSIWNSRLTQNGQQPTCSRSVICVNCKLCRVHLQENNTSLLQSKQKQKDSWQARTKW